MNEHPPTHQDRDLHETIPTIMVAREKELNRIARDLEKFRSRVQKAIDRHKVLKNSTKFKKSMEYSKKLKQGKVKLKTKKDKSS